MHRLVLLQLARPFVARWLMRPASAVRACTPRALNGHGLWAWWSFCFAALELQITVDWIVWIALSFDLYPVLGARGNLHARDVHAVVVALSGLFFRPAMTLCLDWPRVVLMRPAACVA